MDNDDVLIGRLLSRREMLALMGGAGLALVVGCSDDDPENGTPTSAATQGATQTPAAGATAAQTTTAVPSCVVVPELTEGPFFLEGMQERSDIRSDPGSGTVDGAAQLDLTVNVSRIGGDGSCEPLAGAIVDVWQCDALGVYSGVSDIAGQFDTSGETFLRGYQLTSADGSARFTTIYPGWYQGRATHIHFKIRTEDAYEFTSQWFFDDAFSDTVHAQGVYAERGADGRLPNEQDGIYGETNGQLTLAVQPAGNGYAATFDIGLQIA